MRSSQARRWAVGLGLFLLFAAVLVLRRPGCLTHPQFWAEDGAHFYPDALYRPFWLNLTTYAYGYFDVLLRLTHAATALFPLKRAPQVLTVCAIVMQAAVPLFLVSRRTENWLGAFPVRLAAALLYCALPNSFEAHGIALHSRVHLAILAALILVSAPPAGLAGKVFDVVTLAVSGLSGPFVFALLPIPLLLSFRSRSPALQRNLVVLLATLPFALFALLSSTSKRVVGHLGASLVNGARIIGGQFTTSFFLGEKTYAVLLGKPWFDAWAWSSTILFVLLLALLIIYAAPEIRCLLIFGFSLLAMALVTPLAGFDRSHWDALWQVPGCGQRYYVPGMAAILFGISSLAGRGRKLWLRGIGIGLLLLITVMGARVDFVLPPFTDYNFPKYAKRYKHLPAGETISIPINPPGWKMVLRSPNSAQ